ncbi:Josephin-1 [Mortierella sp. NVP85]|nr:Josephin-1 [Mortierella sp. NVP85]
MKHTLNNLLQGPVFSTADLDVIAENLRLVAQESLQTTIWKNPYKSPLGLGYYDVNIAECLSQQDESMVGLIVHVPTSPRWIPFWKGQHWFGILRLSNGAYIDLDSRLSQPVPYAGFDDTVACLSDILKNGGRLFLIHRIADAPGEPEEKQTEGEGSGSVASPSGTSSMSTAAIRKGEGEGGEDEEDNEDDEEEDAPR